MTSDADTRTRILEAAERLFAQRGFAGTTVRELASHAGVNLAMIHYYFGNKEGLYRALIAEAIGQVHAILAEGATSSGSCAERLARIVGAYTDFLCAHPNFARIFQQEMMSGGPVLSEVVQPQIAANYAIIRRTIEEGIARGEFRRVDAELAPVSLIGMVAFFIIASPVLSMALGVGPETEGFASRLADHTIDIFLKGVEAPDRAPAAREESL